MGVLTDLAENGRDVTVSFLPPFKGLYSHDTPTTIPDGFQPDLLNLDVPVGVPEVMAGSTLFATSMDLPGTTLTLFGVWYNSAGTPTYVGANTDGEVYYWTGSAWTYLRRGLSTSTTWWSQTKISTYLVMANKNDGQWKYDGTRLLPLGAKHIADMESTETWAGSGAADTTNVKQGTQSRKLTSTGAQVTTTYTPSVALDLTDAIGPTARNYTTSDLIHFWVYFDSVTGLDTANTYIRFGNAGDTVYYQETAASWGTLIAGWNEVSMAKSIFNTTGSPNWNSIAKVTLALDTTGSTINASFDDLYEQYAVTMPKCQVVEKFKNMLLGFNDTAGVSNVNYARVSGPDDYDVLATFPVNDGDGEPVVGAKTYFDQIVVGKNTSCHSLYVTVSNTTYPAYRWAQTPLTHAFGMASHRSIVEAGLPDGVTKLYWWAQHEVVSYDGSAVQKINLHVDPTIAGVEFTRLPFIVGASLASENQIWWSYTPSGGSANTRLLRFDYAQSAWLPSTGQTLPLLEAVTSSGQEILLSVASTGRVLQQASGTTFDTAEISATIDLPWVSGPLPEQMKRWDRVSVPLANGSGRVTVNYRTADSAQQMDAATYRTAGTIILSSYGGAGEVDVGERSRWIQLQLANVNGSAFQLLSPLTLRGVLLPQRY